jgi:nicotinate-nucleotide adenylyltransferase
MIDDVLLDTAEDYVRRQLSEERYAHTLRVADTSERLADTHGLDAKKAYLAGLLHDAARETDEEELLKVAEEENLIVVSDFERERPILLHGPVAAEFALKDLGVEDREVLEAVRHHTTGEPGMGPLALVLFIADKIEPGREGCEAKRLRKLAPENLWLATTAALRGSISYNERRGYSAHPKSLQTLEWLESSSSPEEAPYHRGV